MDTHSASDPRRKYPAEDFPSQDQDQPGQTRDTTPVPDHGESSYIGAARLAGKRTLITGGDSGIGRAVAIAFAREGSRVAIAHLPEEATDAADTLREVERGGQRGLSFAGDIREESFAIGIVEDTVRQWGGLDVLILNAAYQKNRDSFATLETKEMDRVFQTNLYGLIYSARAAIHHLKPGASIIVTASIQAFDPSPGLIDYAMTKAAQIAFVKALAQELGPKGIRVNAVAPGPIWTPLIPATSFDPEKLRTFGSDTPLGRAGQPAELAGAYVYLASEAASYVSGAVLPVTGGRAL